MTTGRYLSASEASHSLGCSMINRAVYIYGGIRTNVRFYYACTCTHERLLFREERFLTFTLYCESSISLEGGRSKDIVRLSLLSNRFKNFHTRNCSLI